MTVTATLLHQLIAAEKDTKAMWDRIVTRAYQATQKSASFSGFEKRYQPRDEEGTQLPPERQLITAHARHLMSSVRDAMAELVDFTATKDHANQRAEATIVVGDTVLAANVPVTTLLWLEKKLVDLRTFVGALPTLPVDEKWTWDHANGVYTSEPTHTLRQVKEAAFHVAYPATDKHPAQVVQMQQDKVQGTWTTTKFSSAIPSTDRDGMLTRIDVLIIAVKKAREAANTVPVDPRNIGAAIIGYVFS